MRMNPGSKTVKVVVDKEVDIEIAEKDFDFLKANNYRLCFAKMVNGIYNVVWQSYAEEDYMAIDQFGWEPKFQIFCTNTFVHNVKVKASTRPKEIRLGEIVEMKSNGALGEPYSGGNKNAITLENNFGGTHPAISQVSIGVDGLEKVTPIYVAPQEAAKGTVELTPIDKVQVWFQQNIETSTMFSKAMSRNVELDLTNKPIENRVYQNQEWMIPPS